MLNSTVSLISWNIFQAAGNTSNEILHACQCYWISEAICYIHHNTIEELFTNHTSTATGQTRNQVALTDWPELSLINCLSVCKTSYHNLGSILENKKMINSTYSVIDTVFTRQLEYDCEKNFDSWLHLVYSDQKTVSLIHTVQKEWQETALPYNEYGWLLAVSRLFH